MSRATIAQCKQLGLDAFALNQIADADVQAALDSASSQVDSALAAQFTMPIVAPYPMDIITCECVIASWTALMVHGYNPAPGVDTNIEKRYQQWVDWLDKVAKGERVPQIAGATGTSAMAPASGPSVITATTRGYSERGFPAGSPPTVNVDPFSGD